MTKEEIVKYWIDASDLNFSAMKNLNASKDYVWCLFLEHFVIEKLLKAIAIKNGVETVTKIHDLNKLAKATGIEIDNSLKIY